MKPQTLIFIGKSGCGKGTQAEFMMKHFKKTDSSREIYYLETGERFRNFIKGESLSSKLSLELSEKEMLQPSFLAVWMWAHLLIENLKGDEHLICDGTPRSLDEARILDSAIQFYGREGAFIVYLDVSREWALARLSNRGRADDQQIDRIKNRLDWFESSVIAAINHLRENSLYTFLHIDGEQSMEDVHKEIMAKIKV